MAQIFISHSSKDHSIISFFQEVFGGTTVKMLLEEYEKISANQRVDAKKIENDLKLSNAAFLFLSENVCDLAHTRDWVLWEIGRANKDIWVFERSEDIGKVTVIIPKLNHYVLYDIKSYHNECFAYIKKIVDSYDDAHFWPTFAAGSLMGAAVSSEKEQTAGLVLGGLAGIFLAKIVSNVSQIPGILTKCIYCGSSYHLHLLQAKQVYRCPTCNRFLELQLNFNY